jgi:hypothetical protein
MTNFSIIYPVLAGVSYPNVSDAEQMPRTPEFFNRIWGYTGNLYSAMNELNETGGEMCGVGRS